MKNIKIYLLIVLYIVTVIFPFPANAQSLSLSLTPPITQIMIKPGKTISQNYTLINNGDESIIRIGLKTLDKNGQPSQAQKNDITWLNIVSPVSTDNPLLLKKGEKLEIIISISPPVDTEQQDYYHAISIATVALPGNQSRSDVSAELLSPILLAVTESGRAKKAEMTEFALPKLIDSFDGIKTDLTVKNTGQTYFYLNGQLLLKGNYLQAKFPVIPRIYLINQQKKIQLSESDKNKLKGFFIGKYTLTADFVFDEGNIKLTENKVFYALPWKLLLAMVLITLIIIILNVKIPFNKDKSAK